ncbi:MAG: bifunctional phosphoribosylaminoimidazolecarboxamide formyltransferase/IMP cyclohydrolase [Phycisphaerales bacterium]|nr:bifunctional phosphoribosylaminoimidazolecarboxamide formyltransferase/IMP cyclohydrolase [Phycisphaerales bacterium]MCB9837466.1 bifunctional phosphoribosylaminoimidazolecarboxamide formyltransferase/IMP cyclohydrolase [Phycisphaera sp.]
MTNPTKPLALISVSDKSGVAEFARAVAERGYEIISTGGTARTLAESGVDVTSVEQITGFPEMLSGRVKTLHPLIHGGLLGVRDDSEHRAQMAAHGIRPIDLIVIDLYPFEATIAREGVTRDEAIEQIDIGGPAMIRSAAKNHASVAVITDPGDYDSVLEDMDAAGKPSIELRRKLATKAFQRTASYDATIAAYLAGDDEPMPRSITVALKRDRTLRYGENPHQEAAVYRTGVSEGGVLDATQLLGKELSFNNLADAAAAWALTCTLAELEPRKIASVVVKHANPCGAAVADDVFTAVDGAMAGDPVAAFGGIMGVSAEIDEKAAHRLCEEGVFLEVLAAPGFTKTALEILSNRWKNLRLLATKPVKPSSRLIRLLPGGALVQTPDALSPDHNAWQLAAGEEPGTEHRRIAHVIEAIGQALSSNAIALGGLDPDRPGCVRLFGAGAGQMDRLTSCRLACEKSGELARGSTAASDAFFPFDDGPKILADAGVKVIVHPGGSKRDDDTFTLCNERGIACLLTGLRHFRHEPLR